MWIPLAGLVLALVMLGVGFAVGRSTHSDSAGHPRAAATPQPLASETSTAPDLTPTAAKFQPSDFTLRVKVLDKQCFGSAGCNIQYEVTPIYSGETSDMKGTQFDITFAVTGDESGKQIGTISLTNGRYDVEQRTASTSSSSVTLVARVTSVTNY